MQQLLFESAWDRQIAPIDRKYIVELFHETKNSSAGNIVFTPIKQARNHVQALLVTVLIHNFTDSDFPIQDLNLTYAEAGSFIAEHTFSFSDLVINQRTSMPWTFIFPQTTLLNEPSLQDGRLILNDMAAN